MTSSPTAPRKRPAALYLPIADEQATGMQRFGSEIIRAILRLDPDFQVIIGRVDGAPSWLEGISYSTIVGPRGKAWLPRALQPLVRMLWLQFVFPMKLGRGATLIALAHELCARPFVRQIAVAHDVTQIRSYALRQSFAERVRQQLWIAGMRHSDAVIAISGATRHDLIEAIGLSPARLPVIYEGYDPSIFKPAPAETKAPERPYLLYAGTLAPNKNLPFLLEQYARLRARHEIDLVLVGKQGKAEVARLLATVPEGARPSIHFRGFVTDEELATLMQRCTAFVFPSLNEGFGLAVVEAMACGAPTVSSWAGSLREVVGDGGELLDPQDEDAWVDSLERVVANADLRADLSRRAISRAADFSWDEAAGAYLAVIRDGPAALDRGVSST
jgi:glycosyltransferase involved in cell wall biosynthesis